MRSTRAWRLFLSGPLALLLLQGAATRCAAEPAIVLTNAFKAGGSFQFEVLARSNLTLVIQEAPTVLGPWRDLMSATGNLVVTVQIGGANRFCVGKAGDRFSVNAVGYYHVAAPPGLSMIANQLLAPTNTVAALFADVPEGTTLYKFNHVTQRFSINAFDFGEWSNPQQTLLPGEGAFFLNPDPEPFTLTFAGRFVDEWPRWTDQRQPAALSIQSVPFPQAGALDSDLGFPAVENMLVPVQAKRPRRRSHWLLALLLRVWRVGP